MKLCLKILLFIGNVQFIQCDGHVDEDMTSLVDITESTLMTSQIWNIQETTEKSAEKNKTTNADKTTLELFNYIMNVYVDGSLCVFGYTGNLLAFLTFQKDSTTTSNTILLQSMAVADCCFLTYVMLYVVLRSIYPYTGTVHFIHDINSYIVATVLPFGWTAQTLTIWLVLMMAIDRYIVVSYPLKATIWNTATNAKKAVLFVSVAATVFNIPRWIHYYYVSFGNEATSSNSTFISHTSASGKLCIDCICYLISHTFNIIHTVLLKRNTKMKFLIYSLKC